MTGLRENGFVSLEVSSMIVSFEPKYWTFSYGFWFHLVMIAGCSMPFFWEVDGIWVIMQAFSYFELKTLFTASRTW